MYTRLLEPADRVVLASFAVVQEQRTGSQGLDGVRMPGDRKTGEQMPQGGVSRVF